MTSGQVLVDGHDIVRDYRAARAKIGLVPQEIALDIFATVWNTVRFSRGLFGRRAERRAISNSCCAISRCGRSATAAIIELYGRHEAPRHDRQGAAAMSRKFSSSTSRPRASTSNLRRDMWALVRRLRDNGVTDHSDDALHRGGGGNGGSRRRYQRWPHHSGRRKDGADAQARQATADADASQAADGATRRARRTGRWSSTTTDGGSPTAFDARRRRRRHSARCSSASARSASTYNDLDTSTSTLEDIFVDLVGGARMSSDVNQRERRWAIYRSEMARTMRTIGRASRRR